MRMNEIQTDAELTAFMTEPSGKLVNFMKVLKGDIVGLGATGKMGIELIETIVRADRLAGRKRRITVASTFSNPENMRYLKGLGVKTQQGDLSDDSFLNKCADAENVFFMAGFKFGSSADYKKAFRMNVLLPYLVGKKYKHSKIVVFSSCNIYPHTDPKKGGSRESTPLDPKGIYGWTVLGRENAFNIISDKFGTKACLYRLAYAQHLKYGVLIDIAKLVYAGKPVYAPLPYVNLISQRDANEAAIRCLALCENPPKPLNISGNSASVRCIASKMGLLMGKKAVIMEPKAKLSMLGNDNLAKRLLGPYRDKQSEMIEAAANWIRSGGSDWNKPTGFASAEHKY
ncbi:MAG: NAD-dependent epimerase/dehydratase family protein [Candidatus Firestonebacteria bacterium]